MKGIRYIIVLIILASLCSCGQVKYVTQVQHDTTTVYQNNTIYQHDSIYVYKDRYIHVKGDTVYVTETLFKDRWKIKEVHDTVFKEKIKEVEKETPIYIEKKLNWFQKLFLVLGKILSAGLILFIIYKLLKLRFNGTN